jgi:hypothetical protein
MNVKEEAAQAAEKAAELISERGHCKYAYEKNGALCALGALEMALTGWVRRVGTSASFTRSYDVYTLVVQTFEERLGIWPAVWNDMDATTGEDVILGFKKVAEELRS